MNKRPEWIWKYANEDTGIVQESSHPLFNANPNGTCIVGKPRDTRAEVDYWVRIQDKNEEAMKCRIALYGPMHVSIAIGNTSLENYKSGIWDDPGLNCSKLTKIDHAVTLVGYGSELNNMGQLTDYWLVQNSWGPNWGVNGFFKIKRGINLCFIATDAMYPVLKSAIPKPLIPIKTPTDCDVQRVVTTTSGTYIKTLCIDVFAYNYAAGKKNCFERGMRLYRLDSIEANAALIDAAKTKWSNNNFWMSIYVEGKGATESSCKYITSKDSFPEVCFNFEIRN